MSEPTETDVLALSRDTYVSDWLRDLAKSWLRQRERIAALERSLAFAEETISECVAKSAIVDLWHAPERVAEPPGIDAAMKRLDADVARCYGIEHP